jgi:hypothetical protein
MPKQANHPTLRKVTKEIAHYFCKVFPWLQAVNKVNPVFLTTVVEML